MTTTDPLMSAGVDAADSPHYLRALTDMADERTVVASAAIYTDNGIKLVEKGARIDSRLYDRLVQHKLREPIDKHLTIDNPVTVEALIAAGQELAAQDVLVNLLAEAIGSAVRLLAPLRTLALPGPVACKLTVMRDQRPELYQHGLRMMMVAVFLGFKTGMPERECATLAAAALLHDLGVLHMDPAWNDPDFKAVGVQRKHLVAHPITGMLMVRDTNAYPKAAETAVLEHHERMDGSGYPRGLAGADISPMGRILLLAEVVAGFYEKYEDMPAQRLSLVLRLNHRKFPSALVVHILPLLQEEVARESALMPLGDDAPRQAELLADAFIRWDELKAALPPAMVKAMPATSAFAFTDARLMALQKALVEAGSHPQHQAELMTQLQGDAIGLAEVALVGREALFQLQSVLNACHRRWPELEKRATPGDAAVANWCDWAVERL
ncbi:MAG: HD domain-containing phosphohydrolase [Pseudomonadota bacterium]